MAYWIDRGEGAAPTGYSRTVKRKNISFNIDAVYNSIHVTITPDIGNYHERIIRRFPQSQQQRQIDRAATGNPANVYPWGSNEDDGRANTYESGLQRSTVVGMYPHGASPVGALDMSGNLWEWCLNKYDDPRDTALGGDTRRVLRGGSRDGGRPVARAAYRRAFAPPDRYAGVGWRLACSSPTSEPLNTE